MLHGFIADVPECSVKPMPRECRHEFSRSESIRQCLRLATLDEGASDSASRPTWSDEESSNPRRIAGWVEKLGRAPGLPVPAEERLSSTPSATPDDFVCSLGNEVCSVADEFPVYTEGRTQRCFDLRFSVVSPAQPANGLANQGLQRNRIGQDGLSQSEQQAFTLRVDQLIQGIGLTSKVTGDSGQGEATLAGVRVDREVRHMLQVAKPRRV